MTEYKAGSTVLLRFGIRTKEKELKQLLIQAIIMNNFGSGRYMIGYFNPATGEWEVEWADEDSLQPII